MRTLSRWTWFLTAAALTLAVGCATNELPEEPVKLADSGSDDDADGHTIGPDAGDVSPDASTPPDSGDDPPRDGGRADSADGDSPGDGGQEGGECSSDENCSDGQVCRVDRSGAAVDLECGPDDGDKNQTGDSCMQDDECRSNLCLNGTCTKPCERPVQCAGDDLTCARADIATDGGGSETVTVCQPRPETECVSDQECSGMERCISQVSGGNLKFVCDDPAGTSQLGAQCSQNGDCTSNLCVDGHCRIPCNAGADCSGASGYSCETVDVDLGGGQSDDASICVPPTECSTPDACKVDEVCYVDRATSQGKIGTCQPGNTGGASLGGNCQTDSDCESNFCYEGRFEDFCSIPCTDNSHCNQSGFQCAQRSIEDGQGNEQPVKACVKNPPSNCTKRGDCPSGTACAVVVDPQGNQLERVCTPTPRGDSTGATCSSESDCSSNVCINGNCAAPCKKASQCASGQICRTQNVTKSGLTGSFQMCETLPEEECTMSGTCSDPKRVCSDLRRSSQSDPLKAYCQFPDSSATNSVGDNCSSSNECRSDLCLSDLGGQQSPFVGECSKACAQTSQCGGGQLCTSLPVRDTDVGICNSSCGNNSDCSSGEVCQTNENRLGGKPYSLDKICMKRDTSLTGFEGKCDPNQRSCESGFCLSSFSSTTCSSDSDCFGDLTCESYPGGGQRCGTIRCSRLCVNDSDCSGGELSSSSRINFDSCSSTVEVTLTDGTTRNVKACAP